MLVTIIFRNSAAKMQGLNYFTVIILRDQSEVANLSANLFNRNLAPKENDHNPKKRTYPVQRAPALCGVCGRVSVASLTLACAM